MSLVPELNVCQCHGTWDTRQVLLTYQFVHVDSLVPSRCNRMLKTHGGLNFIYTSCFILPPPSFPMLFNGGQGRLSHTACHHFAARATPSLNADHDQEIFPSLRNRFSLLTHYFNCKMRWVRVSVILCVRNRVVLGSNSRPEHWPSWLSFSYGFPEDLNTASFQILLSS
jgi:hypothetical protein